MKKILIIISIFSFSLLACTGDCFTCHPDLLKNIENDNRHIAMKTCINCHKANPESMSECGPDCFGCHTKEKIAKGNIKEHKIIEDCRNCHMKKNMIDLNFDGSNNTSKKTTLKDFLEF